MTDVADTALRRIGRDLRLALPNSVRTTGTCTGVAGTTCFIEFLPTTGGGRYRAAADPTATATACGSADANVLYFSPTVDTCFEVLGPMPAVNVGDQIVVYNMNIPGLDAYASPSNNRRAVAAPLGANYINITSTSALQFDSPSHRFQVITTPVSYVCLPATNGVGGTLTRYWGYAIQATQPASVATLTGLGAQSANLATNVSLCNFTYSTLVVAQRNGLVTMNLGITENNGNNFETVTLYDETHVSNVP
jgi:MSHA biogenesis protein MshO